MFCSMRRHRSHDVKRPGTACLHQQEAILAPKQTFADQGFQQFPTVEIIVEKKDTETFSTWRQARKRSKDILASDPSNSLTPSLHLLLSPRLRPPGCRVGPNRVPPGLHCATRGKPQQFSRQLRCESLSGGDQVRSTGSAPRLPYY